MALRGAHVIIGARNTEAASEVKQSILQSTPSARIDIIQIELSSLKSVRAFAEKFLAMDLPLNILINNVGVMYCPFHLSKDWIEMQFATNHVGHFLLTKLLLDKMKSTAERTGIESLADVILWRKKNGEFSSVYLRLGSSLRQRLPKFSTDTQW
ncbi:hypothetical protein ZIOFF_056730 [Zingiber officinale]|uniref:Uncharacterized protein n=1 Tax=Zingiber officinale TaxID=94328 RepID=A0A8J5FP33_ZINOF|nr:hypothetical protein ZIOFF_056730 [Zingiber officinale]